MVRVNHSNNLLITACGPNRHVPNLMDEFHNVVRAGIKHVNHEGIASVLAKNALNINSQGKCHTGNGCSSFSWTIHGPDLLRCRKGTIVSVYTLNNLS